MITVYKYTNGVVKRGVLSDIHKKEFVWVDCFQPTEKEIQQLAAETKLTEADIKETLDEEERPKVLDLMGFSLVTFRAPLFENSHVSTTPISMFVSKVKNVVITTRLADIRAIDRLLQSSEAQLQKIFGRNAGYFLYRLLDEIFITYFQVLDQIEEVLEDIEDIVFKKPDKKTISKIFETKKTLIYFHKALAANREVITSIEKGYIVNIEKSNIPRFRTLYNDVTQLIDTEGTYRDILTGTLDIYLSTVSNNLNDIMKRMTAMASYILIPTLISGIFGMNFRVFPELNWKFGYLYALGLMIFSVLMLHFYFKKKEWI